MLIEKIDLLLEEVDLEEVDLSDFYISNLLTKTEFGDGLTMEGLLNHYSELRKFVLTFFSEHYDNIVCT